MIVSKFEQLFLIMKAKIALVLVIAIIVGSCNKGDFGTNPGLTFVSVNQTTFNTGDNVVFTLNFTQQSGSLDTLFIRRSTLNCYGKLDSVLNYVVPAFPETNDQKGQITVSFSYGTQDSLSISNGICTAKADTSIFKFCLQDNAGHLSDTVQSPKLVFENN